MNTGICITVMERWVLTFRRTHNFSLSGAALRTALGLGKISAMTNFKISAGRQHPDTESRQRWDKTAPLSRKAVPLGIAVRMQRGVKTAASSRKTAVIHSASEKGRGIGAVVTRMKCWQAKSLGGGGVERPQHLQNRRLRGQ